MQDIAYERLYIGLFRCYVFCVLVETLMQSEKKPQRARNRLRCVGPAEGRPGEVYRLAFGKNSCSPLIL